MADNNLNIHKGEYKGNNVRVKFFSKKILAGALTISLISAPIIAQFLSDDESKELVNEETTTIEYVSEDDFINNPDEEMKAVDAYIDYLNRNEGRLDANASSVIDSIKNKYGKLKEEYNNSNLKDQVEEQKEEFLYSINEILNMADNIQLENFDQFETGYKQKERQQKLKRIEEYDAIFTHLDKFTKLPGEVTDKIYEEYQEKKEKYDLDMSKPNLTDEQVDQAINDYMDYCQNLLNKLNAWLSNKGLPNIPENGNVFEQSSVKKLVKTD